MKTKQKVEKDSDQPQDMLDAIENLDIPARPPTNVDVTVMPEPIPTPVVEENPEQNPEVWLPISLTKKDGIICRTEAMNTVFGAIQREIVTDGKSIAVSSAFIDRAKAVPQMDKVTNKMRNQYVRGM